MRSPVGGHELRQLAGRADKIWTRGDDWVKLAGVMERTATELSAIGDSSVRKSKGTEKLGEKAAENADDLANAAQRYRDTGTVLRTYATALENAQRWLTNNMDSVRDAELQYQSAVEAREQALSKRDDLDSRWAWEPEPSASEIAAASSDVTEAGTALVSAETSRDALWREFDQVFETWEDAYETAVTGIQKAMDSSHTNDGFWEAVDTVLDVVGVVLIVLSVIALVIGAPFTGLLGLVILGLTLLVVGLNLLKFAYGRATLSDVGLSLLGLLPFGIGKVLSRGAPVLSQVVSGGRGVVTAAIRQGLPAFRFLRPTTWATPLRSLVAPVRSWLALPSPGILVNPGRSMSLGSPDLVQVEKFLGHMAKTPWATNPAVRQFIENTMGRMPGGTLQFVNPFLWSSFFALDLSQAVEASGAPIEVNIPGLDDVKLSERDLPWVDAVGAQ